MTNDRSQRGFVGLLGLLITAAVIAFLAVKILAQLYPPSADQGLPGQARSIIDSAEDAKRAIEERNLGI
ncbi:MAG: hypothetical protein HYT46_03275 [Candidatus Vogelbacteria bacterium]|nr:hypothetical protein [Candidatus Vogelbacteria bacterium]